MASGNCVYADPCGRAAALDSGDARTRLENAHRHDEAIGLGVTPADRLLR